MINEELFRDFLQNRVEITGKKKINTDLAVQKLRKKLEGWEITGFNIDHIIEHAIEQGWRGLFLPHELVPKQRHIGPPQAALDLIKGVNNPMPKDKTNRAKHDHANAVRETGNALAKAEKLGGGRAALDEMKAIMSGAKK